MSIAGGPSKALERGRSIGCSAIQIFVKNNMQWFAKPFAENDLAAYHQYPDRPELVFGHASYLINLAATNPDFRDKSIRALSEELHERISSVFRFLCSIRERTWEMARKPV